MNNTLPKPGTHPAITTANMVVYEAESGSLCVAVPLKILGAEVEWSGKATVTLITADGVIKERAIADMKTIFGDDAAFPASLQDVEPGVHPFDAVCEITNDYVPSGQTEAVETFRVKYINIPGGSAKMPEAMDRKELLTKYGSKFKALSKSKPAVKTPAAQAAAKPAPTKAAAPARAASSGPPSRKSTAAVARTCTQEECWNAFADLRGEDRANASEAMQQEFFDAQDAVREGANGEFTIQEWGTIATALGV